MPSFVGDGAGLRRLVLGLIALLIAALALVIGYGLQRTAPRIAKWIGESERALVRSVDENAGSTDENARSADENGGRVPTIANLSYVPEGLAAGPRGLRPRTPPGSWVTNDDYPAEAQRAGEQGTVAFTLSIDNRGMPLRCEVTASSGSERLDRAACDLLTERARFVPALDADRRPMPATYSNRFRWVLSP